MSEHDPHTPQPRDLSQTTGYAEQAEYGEGASHAHAETAHGQVGQQAESYPVDPGQQAYPMAQPPPSQALPQQLPPDPWLDGPSMTTMAVVAQPRPDPGQPAPDDRGATWLPDGPAEPSWLPAQSDDPNWLPDAPYASGGRPPMAAPSTPPEQQEPIADQGYGLDPSFVPQQELAADAPQPLSAVVSASADPALVADSSSADEPQEHPVDLGWVDQPVGSGQQQSPGQQFPEPQYSDQRDGQPQQYEQQFSAPQSPGPQFPEPQYSDQRDGEQPQQYGEQSSAPQSPGPQFPEPQYSDQRDGQPKLYGEQPHGYGEQPQQYGQPQYTGGASSGAFPVQQPPYQAGPPQQAPQPQFPPSQSPAQSQSQSAPQLPYSAPQQVPQGPATRRHGAPTRSQQGSSAAQSATGRPGGQSTPGTFGAQTLGGQNAAAQGFSGPLTPSSAADLSPHNLIKAKVDVPSSGWRRVVFKATAGALNPGLSKEELARHAQIERIRTPVRGCHRIAIVSLKGGIGKTTTTSGLGLTLAQYRGDRVVALDANPDAGTLAERLTGHIETSVRDLLDNYDSIQSFTDVSRYMSLAERLQVIASDQDPEVSEAFDADQYKLVCDLLARFYNVVLTDSGTGMLHSAMAGTLQMADSLVVVGAPSVDGASRAAKTLDWLIAHGHDDLVRRSVAVISSVREKSGDVDMDVLRNHFGSRCRAVVEIPYDPHLVVGGLIDMDQIKPATTSAYLELAATVADGFSQ